MNRTFWICLLLVAVLVLEALPAMAASRTGRQLARDSLVQVNVETRFGTTRRVSGYMFSASGQVVTAFHAVSDATKITVFNANNGVFEVSSILRVDKRADLAVMQLAGIPIATFSVSQLGDTRKLKPGDTVYVAHHPYSARDNIYETQLIAMDYPRLLGDNEFTNGYLGDKILLAVAGPFDSGSAGGIVYNERFEVIGLMLGAGETTATGRVAYALGSTFLNNYLVSSYHEPLSFLSTDYVSDEEYFDRFFGPAPQQQEFTSAMLEGYLAWFSPIRPVWYEDAEFTSEINDLISHNWFQTEEVVIDGWPLSELSAAQIFIWPATINPWELADGPAEYVYFDADSVFRKRVYRDRDTEERIMTRHIIAVPLSPRTHTVEYVNTAANHNTSGYQRRKVEIGAGSVSLLDVEGLSLVRLTLLPLDDLGLSEELPVRYELERRPLELRDLIYGIRKVRYETTTVGRQ